MRADHPRYNMPTNSSETADPKTAKNKPQAWKALPEVWKLIHPRRGLLALGLLLMAVNRVSGLVLPASTKYFLDNVVTKKEVDLLTPIVLSVLAATIILALALFRRMARRSGSAVARA